MLHKGLARLKTLKMYVGNLGSVQVSILDRNQYRMMVGGSWNLSDLDS